MPGFFVGGSKGGPCPSPRTTATHYPQLGMPNYVRARVAVGTYFFTLAARNRASVLMGENVRDALREATETVRARWAFTVDAWVLLPDHLHCLWTLPEGDANFS
jgi:putative transposase